MAEEQKNTDETKDYLELRKNYINPHNLSMVFANEATINSSKNEFHLTFYQSQAPVMLDDSDREKAKEKGTIDVVTVTRIVMTPKFTESVIKMLQQGLERYNKRMENE